MFYIILIKSMFYFVYFNESDVFAEKRYLEGPTIPILIRKWKLSMFKGDHV